MAPYRTSPLHRAHREFQVLRALAGLLVVAFAVAGPTGAAQAPDLGSHAAYEASLPGVDRMVTGSINDIFMSKSFVGPNRALKQDRARQQVALADFTQSFSDIRARIAAARDPNAASDPVQTAKLETPAGADMPAPGDIPVALAAVDPALTSSPALDAIDALAGVPVPSTMSEKLAYARADLPATVFDGPITDKKGKKVSEKELWCMATGIYFEARGESYRGQVAVGQVIMNRVAHKLYPDTICGVVFQNQNKRNACQFSFACDGIPEKVTEQDAWDQAMKIAKNVVSGKEYIAEVGYATHYHATYVYPHWAPKMKKNTKIGQHVFYQFKRGWKFG